MSKYVVMMSCTFDFIIEPHEDLMIIGVYDDPRLAYKIAKDKFLKELKSRLCDCIDFNIVESVEDIIEEANKVEFVCCIYDKYEKNQDSFIFLYDDCECEITRIIYKVEKILI